MFTKFLFIIILIIYNNILFFVIRIQSQMHKEQYSLFYIRYLQIKLYFRNNRKIIALFLLEKYLFENFFLNEEVPTSLIKQKWVYDCIYNNEFSNEISRNFEVFRDVKSKSKVLALIETFGNLPKHEEKKNFLLILRKFNAQFNELITLFGENDFKTDLNFQFVFLIYTKKIKLDESFISNLSLENNVIDIFEKVFLELFVKKKNYKISKILYLYTIILKFIRKK